MSQLFKRLTTCIAALMVVSAGAFAQVTTSSLGGRIVDEQGEPALGVAVVATHEPSGTVYGVITNNDGRYAIQGMRTGGPYKVEISAMGYQTVIYTDVVLQLAETFALNATLKDDALHLEEAVVVASPTSKFASEKTGASVNISSTQITEMPTLSRSITDIAKLSPYGGGGMSFAGANGKSTNFTVDGANFNNNFGLSESLPGGGTPISLDAIEEMQVVISPYDVRQTNFIGGGVNAITKSGTNKFKGTAYYYYKNENMRGNRIEGEELTARDAEESTTTYGFTLGGPIIKNKLFFFVNAERSIIPGVVNRWRPSVDGVDVPDKYISRTTQADMQRVSDYLKSRYGYDPGSYMDYPADEGNYKYLIRLDWNISDKHKLAFRYNYTLNQRWIGTNGSSGDFTSGGMRMTENRLSRYSMAFSNAMYSMDNKVSTVSLDLNSRLSNTLSNQFLVTYSNIEDIRGSNSAKFPFVDIMEGYSGSLEAGNLSQVLMPYMSFGYELFTWNNGVHNKVFNAKDDITMYLGNHKIMAGASVEWQMADNSYMREGTGYYRYRSVDDFLNDRAPETIAITYGYDGELNPAARIRFTQLGLYAQDDWNVSAKLKVNYGIRFDTIVFNDADLMTNNALYALDWGGKHIDSGHWPATNIQISPRVGFIYDVFGDNVLKIRGGSGFFAGRLPLVYFTNMPTNSGMVQNAAAAIGTRYNSDGTIKNRDTGLDKFAGGMVTDVNDLIGKLNGLTPGVDYLNDDDKTRFPLTIRPEDGSVPGTINGIDPHYKMPQVWKSTLAFDWNIPVGFPLTLTAEGMFTKVITESLIKNWNIKDNNGWAQFNGSDNRHIYPSDYRYSTRDAYVLTNTNEGYGWTANVTVNAQPMRNLNIMAAYTHTVSKEMTGMPGSAANSVFQGLFTVDGPNFLTLQNSQYVTPNKVIASVSYKDNANNHFSLYYSAFAAGGYSYYYNNDINGDGIAYDLMYIPKDASDIRFVSPDDADRFWSYVEQDSYLRSHLGQYAEAYSAFGPWSHKIDFMYAHDFTLKIGSTRHALQFNVNVSNVMNLFNSSWGVSSVSDDSALSYKILQLDHIDAEGYPVYSTRVAAGAKSWKLNHGVGQCWAAQIGIKYMFD